MIEAPMTVIKGCEGTYLRLNDLDYSITNEDALDKFENGTTVKAIIIKTTDITGRIHCMMVHNYPVADDRYKVSKIQI